MEDDALVTSDRRPVGWYEIVIPVRGCHLSVEQIKNAYRDLTKINRTFGEHVIATIPRNTEMTDAEWEAHKSFLLDDAFCLTTTINGLQDQKLYGESVEVFEDKNIPKPIKSIFFTNENSFRRHANDNQPINRLSVFLDFGKPELFDPNPLVSAATPNEGNVTVNAQEISFFNAVQKAVEKNLTSQRTWYGAIHRNFAYDIGMWAIALPISLYFSAYFMDQIITRGSELELFRWPHFIYLVGLSLIFYRSLTAYAKWALPVNILKDNKDRALRHRIALGGFTSWLFYKVVSTVYGIIV